MRRSQLAIDDMMAASGGTPSLWTGSNFNRLMQHSYSVGARIHSISAGKSAGSNFYGNGAQVCLPQWRHWFRLCRHW